MLIGSSLLQVSSCDFGVSGDTGLSTADALIVERADTLLSVVFSDGLEEADLCDDGILISLKLVDAILDLLDSEDLLGVFAEGDAPVDVASVDTVD